MRLLLWAVQQGGCKVRGTSSGFRLPGGSALSPYASVIRLYRWQALTAAERHSFAPLFPDLAVELAGGSGNVVVVVGNGEQSAGNSPDNTRSNCPGSPAIRFASIVTVQNRNDPAG